MFDINRNSIEIEVTGLEHVKKMLAGLPRDIADKMLDKSVREGVVRWQKAAQAAAPMSSKVHVVGRKGKQFISVPGNLKRSIMVKKMRTEKFALTQESRYGIVISARAFYWRWVEFGSRNNQRVSFLRNTFDALADMSIRAIAGDCAKHIEKYFKSRR